MALQWYLTRYARLSNGEYELLTYTSMPSFEAAQYKARTPLPNNEFFEAECRIGSLLPKAQPCLVARDVYSHKPHIAQLQHQAEVKAQQILSNILVTELYALKGILSDMQLLKPLLTKSQYDTLLDTLMSRPCVSKILYERGDY